MRGKIKPHWNAEEIAALIFLCKQRKRWGVISDTIGRSIESVKVKARRLKISNNYFRPVRFVKDFKKSIAKKGSKNPMWKGDDISYVNLHVWVKNNKPRPGFCEKCNESPPRDLANVSGKYFRDVNDFEWLCRKCHMNGDGRLAKLIERNRGHLDENYVPMRDRDD